MPWQGAEFWNPTSQGLRINGLAKSEKRRLSDSRQPGMQNLLGFFWDVLL